MQRAKALNIFIVTVRVIISPEIIKKGELWVGGSHATDAGMLHFSL
jgi:hypothetical protein